MQVKLEADNITIAAATMRILRLSLAECQERESVALGCCSWLLTGTSFAI